MNIFYFDHCPVKSAKAQPDKLLVKMPLESAQMLCTAHRVLDGDVYADACKFYKKTHMNHPCSVWVRESSENYKWLYEHFAALAFEYTFRYDKNHLSYTKFHKLLAKLPDNIPTGAMTPVAQAMPDEYRDETDPTQAYRNYVIHEKNYAKWEKARSKPGWWVK